MTSSEPEHELMIDTTSPPDEITKRAVEWIKYVKGKKRVTEKSVGSIELWDFAGQQLYYASHPVFLTSRAIYILVCNLSKPLHDTAQPCVRQGNHNFTLDNPNGETNLENLLSWLSTVHSITQMRRQTRDDAEGKLPHLRPPVIIVGTHADKPGGLSNTVDQNLVVSPCFPSENRRSSGVKSYQVYWMHWTQTDSDGKAHFSIREKNSAQVG